MKSLYAALALLLSSPAQVDAPKCHGDCKTSDAGVVMVQHFEGFMPFVYKDIAGKPTIGFGHLVRPGEKFDQPMLPEEADKLLRIDLAEAEGMVNRRAGVPLAANQFDALVSITFNIGPSVVTPKTSTLIRLVKEEKHAEVPPQFLRWNKARINAILQPSPGLTTRRQTEADWYAH